MSENPSYNTIGEVRIVSLPKMFIASYRAISITPEADAGRAMDKLIKEYDLKNKPGFRRFGFNNPDPEPNKAEYGYEMWVSIPEDLEVPEPYVKKEFSGGLYASIPTYLNSIGERWGQLFEWLKNSEKVEVDWRPESMRHLLEEPLDHSTNSSGDLDEENFQLDLLVPVNRKQNK